MRDRDWKPSTVRNNCGDVNKHLNPAFGSRRVERITAEEIEQWRDTLVDERDLSRRSANKLLIILGAILEGAVKAHSLIHNQGRPQVPRPL